ncbi:MAG: (Fe-S)-binding protein [Candidatus Bathyarchaeia archaeon]
MSLEKYRRDMLCCTRCGFCKVVFGPFQKSWRFNSACPIHKKFGFDAYSAQGLLYIAYNILEGKLNFKGKLPEIIYSCTTCGFCDYACKWTHANAEVLDIILELRANAVESGAIMRQHQNMVENSLKYYNIYGRDPEERFKWVPEGVKISEKADIAYFVGCTTAYLKPEIAKATVKILDAANVDFMLLKDEHCCGAALWRIGQRKAAKRLMEHNVEIIRRSGVKTLLVSCAHCCGTFKREYPKVVGSLGFKVMHMSELISSLIREGKLRLERELKMKLTYHDPCLLGRLCEEYIPWEGKIKRFGISEPPKTWLFGSKGIYDPPREVLRAINGIELVEMERTREYAWCCGAGGGVRETFPEFALWVAKERIEEAKTVAAEAIVSCCPRCAINFEEAIKVYRENMKYYDLVELVLKALH